MLQDEKICHSVESSAVPFHETGTIAESFQPSVFNRDGVQTHRTKRNLSHTLIEMTEDDYWHFSKGTITHSLNHIDDEFHLT